MQVNTLSSFLEAQAGNMTDLIARGTCAGKLIDLIARGTYAGKHIELISRGTGR